MLVAFHFLLTLWKQRRLAAPPLLARRERGDSVLQDRRPLCRSYNSLSNRRCLSPFSRSLFQIFYRAAPLPESRFPLAVVTPLYPGSRYQSGSTNSLRGYLKGYSPVCTLPAGFQTVIGSRLKQSGMFWTVWGANAILAPRCCHLNRRFEDYGGRRAA